jgi:uncharacterized membrane protein
MRLLLFLLFWPALLLADDLPPILPALYQVTGVAGDDQLNIRAAPDAGAAIIGALAHDRTAVEVIRFSASGRWAMVNHAETAGWVAARYLRRSEGWAGPMGFAARNLTCYGTEPFWSLAIHDDSVTLSTPEGTASSPVLARYISPDQQHPGSNTAFFDWQADGLPVRSHILPGLCHDGMSDRLFGLHYLDQGLGYRGCCSLY